MKYFGIAIVLITTLSAACGPNQRIINSSAEQTQKPISNEARTNQAANSFGSDLASMQTADFAFIYVLRRKDGGPLDADDKRFASQAIPTEMNRRTVSDSGKAIIIGSNFRMPDENIKVLSERFAFEDLSRPGATNTVPQPTR